VYWAHPVARQYQDPVRCSTRTRFDQYRRSRGTETAAIPETNPAEPLRLIVPILASMRAVAGWLEEDEAELLIVAAERALTTHGDSGAIVEVGSYLGRATVVLASVVKSRAASVRVHAIDPHEGHVGALDTGLTAAPSSPALLRSNLLRAGVADFVEIHHGRPTDLEWDQPLALLLVDGLHDYPNVARDFFRFEPFLSVGAYVAFHDYASYFPGVLTFVDELLESGEWSRAALVRSMIVLKRLNAPHGGALA
jgi:hypothetical protein